MKQHKVFTKKEVQDISGLLYDLYLVRLGELPAYEVEEVYKRDTCLMVANRLFKLNIPEVVDIRSPNYVSEVEILTRLVKAIQ